MLSTFRAVAALSLAALTAACASGPETVEKAPPPSAETAQLIPKSGSGAGSGDRNLYVDRKTGLDVEILDYADLTGWADDDHGAALFAFRRSCAKIRALRSDAPIGGFAGGRADWLDVCHAADRLNPSAMRAFLEVGFTPVRLDPDNAGKATSYYEPIFRASRQPTDRYRHPIYRTPPEVEGGAEGYGVRSANGDLRPFATRGEIDAGALKGRGLEIAYLADPVDLFFLHIQGSGRLEYRDGSAERIGFAAKNGHPYASVAQAMVRRGWARPGQASADYIRAFYRQDPERGREALAANRSYIFFRPLDGLDDRAGPIGALGVQLTDGRSIAVDRDYTPLGAPVWVSTQGPELDGARLVVAQDTGSAIKGPQRIDYYWGSGADAGDRAGRVNQPATVAVLLPNALLARLTGAGS
ncbi:MAG: MltA domain-containing protein [Pseudomonadota bacterium]